MGYDYHSYSWSCFSGLRVRLSGGMIEGYVYDYNYTNTVITVEELVFCFDDVSILPLFSGQQMPFFYVFVGILVIPLAQPYKQLLSARLTSLGVT